VSIPFSIFLSAKASMQERNLIELEKKNTKAALFSFLAPDKSLIFKLSSGLSSYDDSGSSLPRQAQQHKPIRATNATQATDKPAMIVPLLSLLLCLGSVLPDFFTVATSG
jgi:hypothetical protein